MTAEQAALVQKARDSLRGARVLAQDALPDFAAGRAYYTMFYLAQALLIEQGLTFSKHASTISAFGLHWTKTGRVEAKYHRYLLDAFDARLTGDYSASLHLSAAVAATKIAQAEEFLAMAEGVLASLP